jgi:hypothetical protein
VKQQRSKTIMVESFEDLEATYGHAAPFSEHKRGDHVRYLDCDGNEQTGTIIWVQARFENIPQKYVIVPDTEGAFLDFALPSDVLTQQT